MLLSFLFFSLLSLDFSKNTFCVLQTDKPWIQTPICTLCKSDLGWQGPTMPSSAFREEDSRATTSQQQVVVVTDFFPPGLPSLDLPRPVCGLLIKLKEKRARANQEGRGEEFRACPERKGAGAARATRHFRGWTAWLSTAQSHRPFLSTYLCARHSDWHLEGGREDAKMLRTASSSL